MRKAANDKRIDSRHSILSTLRQISEKPSDLNYRDRTCCKCGELKERSEANEPI